MKTEQNRENQAKRRVDGRFARGVSGNPKGRPKGTRSKVTVHALDLLDGATAGVVEKLVQLARAGDPVALRLCIERMVPRDRVRSVVVSDLPKLEQASDIAAAAARVIELAAQGEMTLHEAQGFLALLSAQRAILETVDLAIRIEALEAGTKRNQ